MASLKQRIKVEATLKDGVSRGLEGIRKSSEKSLGANGGLAAHAGSAKLALAGIATVVVGVSAAILKMTRDVSRHNDELAKMSLRIGASTEALSQYEFVAKRSGVEFRTLAMGWQRMTRRISEAAKGMGEARGALKELNLSASDLNRLAPEDQFEAIADAMQGVNGQADKVRLSMKLFDSEGVALVQTMAGGATAIRELRAQAHELGLTLTGDAAKAAEAFEDQLTNLTAKTDALKKAFAEGLIKELGNFENAISGPDMTKSAEHFGGLLGTMSLRAAGLLSILVQVNKLRGLQNPAQFAAELAERKAAALAQTAEGGIASGEFTPTTRATFLGGNRTTPPSAESLLARTAKARGGIGRLPAFNGLGIGGKSIALQQIKPGKVAGERFRSQFERALSSKDASGTTGPPSILNMLAFGKATDTQSVIDRIADKTGDRAAARTLQGWRTRTAKDGEQDVVLTFGDLASGAGDLFVDNLDTALTLGLAEFIIDGDLKRSVKTFGATLAAGMAIDTAGSVSGSITKGIKKLGSGIEREDFVLAGESIGRSVSSGITTGLGGVSDSIVSSFDRVVPDSFATQFGVDGEVGSSVKTHLSDAIVGGVVGAGIGDLIGDEVAAKAGAIGGALGGAFAGPVGSVVASITAALATKVPVVGEVISDIFGITGKREKSIVQDLGVDIQAFGGLEGFIKRIGGLEGIKGTRGEAIRSDSGKDALQKLIRLQLGTTRGQASDVTRILHAASLTPTGGIKAGRLQSSGGEVISVLKQLGFSDADIARVDLSTIIGDQTAGTGTIALTGADPVTAAPPPPATKPIGTTSRSRLSLSAGIDAFASGGAGGSFMSSFLASLGTSKGDAKGNNILNLVASGGADQGARQYLSRFYDIVAARGYHGVVNRPTTILAGEAGPERVDITPGGAGFVGGASNGRQTIVHFNVKIEALDPRGVRDLMEGEVGDMLIERIRASSERGETVVYSSGVTTPPSV